MRRAGVGRDYESIGIDAVSCDELCGWVFADVEEIKERRGRRNGARAAGEIYTQKLQPGDLLL